MRSKQQKLDSDISQGVDVFLSLACESQEKEERDILSRAMKIDSVWWGKDPGSLTGLERGPVWPSDPQNCTTKLWCLQKPVSSYCP